MSTSASPAIPDVPYTKGFKAQLVAHVPPHPYNSHAYESMPLNVKCLPDVPTVQAVLQIPPRERSPGPQPKTATPPATPTCSMEVIDVISGGQKRGSQLVRCVIKQLSGAPLGEDQPSFEAVAKIFDPLYYAPEYLHPNIDCCVMHRADGDYTREAAAYEALRDARHPTAGASTARYHGSWTFFVPHPSTPGTVDVSNREEKLAQILRPVRMVLLEHLDGCSLHSLMIDESYYYIKSVREDYHESYRLEVWAKYLEAQSLFADARIRHEDDAPRNVMLVPRPQKHVPLSEQPAPRVVLIDFNFSVVYDRVTLEDGPRVPPPEAELPENPLQEWFGHGSHDYATWLPEWYENDRKRREEWMLQQFGGKNAMKWRPLYKSYCFDPEVNK